MKRQFDFLIGIPLVRFFSFFPKRAVASTSPSKILVIKLAAAGDTILMLTVMRQLRAAFPSATIDWLVSSINRSIAVKSDVVNHFWEWPGFRLFGLLELVRRLRRERYDVVIDFEQWSRGTALLAYFSSAPIRLGFKVKGQYRDDLFTLSYEKKFDQHEIDDFYALADLLHPLVHDRTLYLKVSDAGEGELKKIMPTVSFAKERRKVLLHPGCGSDGLPREWPLTNYVVLGNWLMKKWDAALFLSAGPEEASKTRQLQKLLNGLATNAGGRLTWEGLISLVERMDLVISGNTGVMHVAAALGRKQVVLQGPTNALLWGPLNSKAIVLQSSCPDCPCLRLGFEYHRRDQSCMARIEPETVKESIDRLFDKK